MPIDIFTGQPGNGKTTFMMSRLIDEVQKKLRRPLYAGGIDGLCLDGVEILENPAAWNAYEVDRENGACDCDCTKVKDDAGNVLDHPRHNHTVVPDGALVFVDEAWKWFGHLQDASKRQTPKHVLDLAEHRHRGIDFVWTTQMPNQLYPFIRGLVGEHTHVVRRFGTKFVDLFKWQELQEDVKSAGKRELAQRTTSALPIRKTKDAFKSATVHTIKARLPWKVWALPVLFVAAIVLGVFAYRSLRPEAVAQITQGKGEPAGQPAGRPSSESFAGNASRAPAAPLTPVEYVAQRTPRIESVPASAPIYDGRAVQQYPTAYCVVSAPGRNADGTSDEGGCTCYTQQMTRVPMHPDACRKLATDRGEFDPYLPARVEPPAAIQQAAIGGAGGVPPAVDGAVGAAPVAPDSASAEPVAAYGWFRDQQG